MPLRSKIPSQFARATNTIHFSNHSKERRNPRLIKHTPRTCILHHSTSNQNRPSQPGVSELKWSQCAPHLRQKLLSNLVTQLESFNFNTSLLPVRLPKALNYPPPPKFLPLITSPDDEKVVLSSDDSRIKSEPQTQSPSVKK